MIQKIFADLRAAGLELGSEDLADALWLVSRGFFATGGIGPAEETPGAPPPPPTRPPSDPPQPKRPETPPSQPEQVARESEPPTQKEVEAGDEAELRTPVTTPSAASGPAPVPSKLAVRTPAAPGLPGGLELMRSLRPLRRRVSARHAAEFDEEATVLKIVEQQLWIPELRPGLERWLELALVVDTGVSMQVWHPTVRELRLLFERLGAFRDVRVWKLDTAQRGQATLRTQYGAAPRPTAELSDASGRRAVVVVTDCIGPAWDDAVPRVLADWSRTQPVAILQLFPERRWRTTALGSTHRVTLNAPAAGLPNARLRASFPPAPPGWVKPSGPPIPVLTAEPLVLRQWARLVARGGNSNVPAVVFEPEEADLDRPADGVGEGGNIPPAIRVARFQSTASDLAFRLARLLAAAPLQLPVMRLVQQAMLPASRQVHLAELFVSGLIERVTPASVSSDPDLIEYAFHEGVDDVLLAGGRAAEMVDVLRAVSAYVTERFGGTLDFQAFIADPRLTGDMPVVAAARPFARIAAKVLARLGGRYEQAAKKLIRRVVREDKRDERRRGGLETSPPSPLVGKWILWVDDNPAHHGDQRARLEVMGVKFITATTTPQALAELARRPFDAIISDLDRAEQRLAGLSLLDAVNALDASLPFVIYSRIAARHAGEALRRGALLATDNFDAARKALEKHFREKAVGRANPPEPYLTNNQTRRLRKIFKEWSVPPIANAVRTRLDSQPAWQALWQGARSRRELTTRAVQLVARVFAFDSVQWWLVDESGLSLVATAPDRTRAPGDDADTASVVRGALREPATVYYPQETHVALSPHAGPYSRTALVVPVMKPGGRGPVAAFHLESPSSTVPFPPHRQEWLVALARSLAAIWSDLPETVEADLARDAMDNLLHSFDALDVRAALVVALRIVRRLFPLLVLTRRDDDETVREALEDLIRRGLAENFSREEFAGSDAPPSPATARSVVYTRPTYTREEGGGPFAGFAGFEEPLRKMYLAVDRLVVGEGFSIMGERSRAALRETVTTCFEAIRAASAGGILKPIAEQDMSDLVQTDIADQSSMLMLAEAEQLSSPREPLWSDQPMRGYWFWRPADPAMDNPPRGWVLAAGLGGSSISSKLAEESELLGTALAYAGYGLICGGWPGVDEAVARGFVKSCDLQKKIPWEWCEQIVEREFEGVSILGRPRAVDSDESFAQVATSESQVAVLLSGAGYTGELAERMRRIGKPVLPLAATGGDSGDYHASVLADWEQYGHPALRRDEFRLLEEETSAAIGLLLHLLPRLVATTYDADWEEAEFAAALQNSEVPQDWWQVFARVEKNDKIRLAVKSDSGEIVQGELLKNLPDFLSLAGRWAESLGNANIDPWEVFPSELTDRLRTASKLLWMLDQRLAPVLWELIAAVILRYPRRLIRIDRSSIRRLGFGGLRPERPSARSPQAHSVLLVGEYTVGGRRMLLSRQPVAGALDTLFIKAGYAVQSNARPSSGDLSRYFASGDFRIMHVALDLSHGVVVESPEALLLEDYRGLLTETLMRTIAAPEVVFLSLGVDAVPFAEKLLNLGTKVVITADRSLSPVESPVFAVAFYTALLAGQTLGDAVKAARWAVYFDSSYQNYKEWFYQCYGDPFFRFDPPYWEGVPSAIAETAGAAMERAPFIYVSFNGADRHAAQAFAGTMSEQGVPVWIDRDLPKGESSVAEADWRIQHCRLFVALFSRHTSARQVGWFWREWRFAQERMMERGGNRSFIIPVVIDDLDVSALLRKDVLFAENPAHFLHCPGGIPSEEQIGSIIDAMRTVARTTQEQPDAPPSA